MQFLSRSRVARAAALALLLFSSACASDDAPAGPDASPGEEAAPLQVTVVTMDLILDRITAEVTAPDISPALLYNLPLSNGVASGIIRVPPGENRTITLRAYDETGAITHEGSRTVTVRPGMNMPGVTITLRARAGQVPISGTLGTLAVEVTPTIVFPVVGEGQTIQFTVQVIDLATNTQLQVADAEIVWAVSNPAFATVSSTGLVSGVLPGSLYVVAAYDGIAGVSPLTVLEDGRGIVSLSLFSPVRGPIQANVELQDGGGFSTFGSTNVNGTLVSFPLPSGPGTVIVTNVPAGCVAPAPQPIFIPDGGQTSVEVPVSCTP